MKIQVHGAAGGEVTGSAYLVRTARSAVLVDVGLFQGGRQAEALNRLPEGATPDELDAVLLTHGHLDHTGRVPLLVKHGYNGPIYATQETLQLSQIILQDSARLQMADTMRRNRKAWRNGEPQVEPLYSTEHVEHMKELERPIPFNSPVQVTDDITAQWIGAGHMLGSGSIELTVNEDGRSKVVVFSGDLGPLTLPLLKPFEHFTKADLVFLESTYGDRDHKSYAATVAELEAIVKDALASGAKMLVPTFAIGRAQQLVYHLAELLHSGRVAPFPVYLDSPMALSAFDVYKEHQDLLDEEYQELKRRGVYPLDQNYFIPSPTAKDSKRLNEVKGSCMILAGAGMCNGGRILHHLAHNIDDPNAHVLIVGFQSQGSLGRRLVDRVPQVNIFGVRRNVRIQVHTLNGFSAHAGQTELLEWFGHLAPSKPMVMLTHGEDGPRQALAEMIRRKHGINAQLPRIGDVIEI